MSIGTSVKNLLHECQSQYETQSMLLLAVIIREVFT